MSKDIQAIIATDCGSTTTKAILIEKVGQEYRQTYRGEAPTTVEAPFEDVTMGVLNAVQEVAEISGRRLVGDDGRIMTPARGKEGCDLYISTSSAGGGLQMMVAGVVRSMTAESAERAALGAGSIVMDVIACNDKRLPHEQIERIRQLRPDMILVSGFNVYPNEVEDVIAMMPGVLEVAAIGVPDDKSGEAVKVFVVKKDSSLTADQDFSSPDGLVFTPSTGICWIQTDDGAYTDVTNCMMLAALPGQVGDGGAVTVSGTNVTTYRGKCPQCGEVRSTHPAQVSTAVGAAGTHLGARALAFGALLNKRHGLTLRRTPRVSPPSRSRLTRSAQSLVLVAR